MSLRVWLPLNGDLHNQGLSNISLSGSPVWGTGKIGGKSFCCNTGIAGITINDLVNVTEFSIAYWLYIDSSITDFTNYADAWELQAVSGDTTTVIRDELRANTANLGRHAPHMIKDANVGSNTYTYYNLGERDDAKDKWCHVVITKNATYCDAYANGVRYAHVACSNFESSPAKLNGKFWLGMNGCKSAYLNDFRIYDHCLSLMEIKELAKGLILHYPLNRNGWGNENLILNSTTKTSGGYNVSNFTCTANTSVSEWGCTDAYRCTGSGGTNTIIGTLGIGQASDSSSAYSYSVWVKNNHSTKKIAFSTNHAGVYSEWLNPGQAKRLIVENAAGNGSSNIQLNWRTQTVGDAFDFTYWHPKIELGNKVTPWTPGSSDTVYTSLNVNGTTEYDCSGFCNNGSKMTDTITYTSDTAKYVVSTHFNGTYDGILIENLQLSDIINSAVTYAFWIKPEGESGARSVYFGSFSTGPSWSIEKTTGNVVRSYWNGSPDETCSGATITDGVWQHVCLTKSGTNDIKVYINGVQKWTSTATHSNLSFPTTFRIGRDTRSNDGTPYKGLMSDFRIYATALSAEDIKSLYQNAAYIDSSGNVYGAIHMEA